MTAKMFEYFLGQIDRTLAARDRCPDGEDASNASLIRASQHIVEVRREIGVIEVGVGFD